MTSAGEQTHEEWKFRGEKHNQMKVKSVEDDGDLHFEVEIVEKEELVIVCVP